MIKIINNLLTRGGGESNYITYLMYNIGDNKL